MATDSRYYQDVESRAGNYPPEVYALLTFANTLELTPDELSGNFIPFHATSRSSKPFIIGLVPPQDTITGRLLDRSASLSRVLQTPPPTPATARQQDTTTGGGTPIPDGPPVQPKPGDPPSKDPRMNPELLSSDFWDQFVQMCNRLGVDPKEMAPVLYTESGLRSGIINYVQVNGKPTNQPQAKGFNQNIKSIGVNRLGLTPEEWDTMENLSPEQSLEITEKYFKKANVKGKKSVEIYGANFGGFPNPNETRYSSKKAMDQYLIDNGIAPFDPSKGYTNVDRSVFFQRPNEQQKAIEQNPGLVNAEGTIKTEDLARILTALPQSLAKALAEAQARVGTDKGVASSFVTGSTSWAKSGNVQAQKSQAEIDALAGKDLNQSNLGQRYAEAQRSTILALASAVEQMRNTPPLRLLVNPVSFKVAGESLVNNSEWSRTRPIIQHHGKAQEKVEASGAVAAFYAQDRRGAGPGVTATAAQFSAGMLNFRSLYLLYRNNGAIFQDASDGSRTIALMGSVFIYYDGILYVGRFENFSITLTEEKQFTLEYSFSFIANYSFVLDRVADPRFTYNLPDRTANLNPSTVPPGVRTLSPQQEADTIQNMENNRLEQEANDALRRESTAAAAARDAQIGVFSNTSESQLIEQQILAKIGSPSQGNKTLKQKGR